MLRYFSNNKATRWNPFAEDHVYPISSQSCDQCIHARPPRVSNYPNTANARARDWAPPPLCSLHLGSGYGGHEEYGGLRPSYSDVGNDWTNSNKDENHFGRWGSNESTQEKANNAWDINPSNSGPSNKRRVRSGSSSQWWPSPNIDGLQYLWNPSQDFKEAETIRPECSPTWNGDGKDSKNDHDQARTKGSQENDKKNGTDDAGRSRGQTGNPWDEDSGNNDWENDKREDSWSSNNNGPKGDEGGSKAANQEWGTDDCKEQQWNQDNSDKKDEGPTTWNAGGNSWDQPSNDNGNLPNGQNDAGAGNNDWQNDNSGQDQAQNDAWDKKSNHSQQNAAWANSNWDENAGNSKASSHAGGQFNSSRNSSCDGSGQRRKERLSRPYLAYPSLPKDYFQNAPSHISKEREQQQNSRVKLDKLDGPMYKLPDDIVKARKLDCQVRGGPEFEYYHRACRQSPNYIDTVEKPYATFVFHYRSRQALGKILRASLKESDEEYKNRMASLSKEEILEELLKMKASFH
jgi:hypothetical protein